MHWRKRDSTILVLVDAVDSMKLLFEPAGMRQLKGFDEPVAVRSLVRAD